MKLFAVMALVVLAGVQTKPPAGGVPASFEFHDEQPRREVRGSLEVPGTGRPDGECRERVRIYASIRRSRGTPQKIRGEGTEHSGFSVERFWCAGTGIQQRNRSILQTELRRRVRYVFEDRRERFGPGSACTNTSPAHPKYRGDVAWNFEKFLIGRNGEVIAPVQV